MASLNNKVSFYTLPLQSVLLKCMYVRDFSITSVIVIVLLYCSQGITATVKLFESFVRILD